MSDPVRELPGVDSAAEYLVVARRIMGTARGLVGDGQVAEDLVFDVLASMLPRWHTIRGDKVAYARTALVNRFRDRLRRSAVETANRAAVISADTAADATDQAVDRVDVSRALQTLPERTRRVLVLRYQAGLTSAEVARLLALPSGSVRRIAHEGLQILHRTLRLSD